MVISGATGVSAALINGVLEPTQEKGLDGRVLYAKRGDASVCIEHYAGKWSVKDAACKRMDAFWANVAGGCGLEACTSRVWTSFDVIGDGEALHDADDLKLVAEAEVS